MSHETGEPHRIVEKSRNSLSEEYKAGLGEMESNYRAVITHTLNGTRKQRDIREKKRPRFTWQGEEVCLHDITDNVLCWVQRFIKVADAIVQYDPHYTALPWGAVRFFLQVRHLSIVLVHIHCLWSAHH